MICPDVTRFGPTYSFYSNENQEPPHIHIAAGEDETKLCLAPVLLASNHGFRTRGLNEIERLVTENETEFVEAWDDYFGEP